MSDFVAPMVAAALGLLGVVMSVLANNRISRIEAHAAQELEKVRVGLTEAKEIRAESRSKRAQAEATVSRYREPLVSTAFDLQGRIYNICRGRFFGADREDYHLDHTLYVFGQYFCWREIIRYDIQLLDLGDEPELRSWESV